MRKCCIPLFAIGIGITGCNPSAPISTPEDIALYSRIDTRQSQNEALWLFQDWLGGLRSKENYVIEGSFLSEEGFWTVHSHFNGFAPRDGVQITARRNKDDLIFHIQTPQFAELTYKMDAPFQSARGDFRYRIEVHNGTADGARVLIWKDWLSLQGEVNNRRVPIQSGNAEYDSRRGGGFFWSSGRGARWGLEFQNAQITRVSREAPYAQ